MKSFLSSILVLMGGLNTHVIAVPQITPSATLVSPITTFTSPSTTITSSPNTTPCGFPGPGGPGGPFGNHVSGCSWSGTPPFGDPFTASEPWGIGGPFGGNWGSLTDSGAWTAGPWTSWWAGKLGNCPPATWSGWTSGPWGTAVPWTSWTACTADTTGSTTWTSTVSATGTAAASVVTGVSFNLQVKEAGSSAGSELTVGRLALVASLLVGLGMGLL